MTGRRNPQRGAELEREVVQAAELHGFKAERVRSKGGTAAEYDVNLDGVRIECKRRKTLPAVITEAFRHDVDAAVIRQDGDRTAYIIFTLDDWLLNRSES